MGEPEIAADGHTHWLWLRCNSTYTVDVSIASTSVCRSMGEPVIAADGHTYE